MTLPAILAALAIVPVQDPVVLAQPQAVAEPTRLALTPTLDGMIRADEWDSFVQSNDGETFFQWEPGKLYFAGRFKADRELVVSMDIKHDGWLIGKDNIEIRLRYKDGFPTISARQLDGTRKTGPTWLDLSKINRACIVRGREVNGEVEVEAMVLDPGMELLPIREKQQIGLRMDVVAQSSQATEPFLPRNGAVVRLSSARASAMPVGLDWKVEEPGRSVTQGRVASVRFSFSAKANPGLKRIEIKPMGLLAQHAATLKEQFPQLQRGRAFVDYEAKTTREAPTGYHLVTTTLFTGDGIPSMIQASIRVAPLVDFSLVEDRFTLKPGVQEFKIPFYIESNSTLRLDGTYAVEEPPRWTIRQGMENSFLIYNSRASVRRVLTVRTPADSSGIIPLKFTAKIGDRVVEQIHWITIIRK
jgi:hypothetical protein